MSPEPEAGLVIRYDFLWKDEWDKGAVHGQKDRPCAIILVTRPNEDNTRNVLVCPVTHRPPRSGETAVEIPYKVARHLKLDHDRMWIKTHEVNRFQWEAGRIPFGVVPTPNGEWQHGLLPRAISVQAFNQVRENSKKRNLATKSRDEVT